MRIVIENEELKKNLETLFYTRAGSQPADRDFGIDWKCLDNMPEIAKNQFILEAHRKVKKYEPRVKITSIDFTYKDGQLEPVLYFGGADG